MPIQLACPSCGRQLRVPDNLLGQQVKCPSCEKTFTANVAEAMQQPKESFVEEPRLPAPPPRYDEGEFDDLPPRRRKDYAPHRGTLILVLGILSVVTGWIGLILGICAWSMGSNDLN